MEDADLEKKKQQWCELARVRKRIWDFLGQPHQMVWRTSVMFIRVSGPCVWLKGGHTVGVWAGNLLDPAQEKHSRPPLVACSGMGKAGFLVVAGRVVTPGSVYSNTGKQLGERYFTVEGWSGYCANKEPNSFPPKFRRAWSRQAQCYLAVACDEFTKVGCGVARPLLRFWCPWDSVNAHVSGRT